MLQSLHLLERNWMLALLFVVGLSTAAFMQVTPPPSFWILFSTYVGIFSLSLVISTRHHRRSERTVSASELIQAAFVLVIVPARNEEAVIAKTIETLLRLDYPNYQLLAVDDRSTDETAQILKGLQMQHPDKIRVHTRIAGAKSGKAAALNEVTDYIESDVIAIFDADTIVAEDFLRRAIPYFDDQNVAAVQARKSLLNAKENLLTKCQHYEYLTDAHFQCNRDKVVGAVELRGNGMLIRTAELHKLGGFNENNLTEDLDLSTRMHVQGSDIRYAANVQVFEECPSTLLSFLHQRTRWTEGCLIRCFEHAPQVFTSSLNSFRSRLDCFLFVFQFVAPLWLTIESICVFAKASFFHQTLSPVFFASSAILLLSLYFFYAAFRGIIDFKAGGMMSALGGAILVSVYLSAIFPLIVIYLTIHMLCRTDRNLKWIKIPHYGVLAK